MDAFFLTKLSTINSIVNGGTRMSDNNLNDLDNSNAEMYRRSILSLTSENEQLKNNVKDLQEQLQNSYKRINQLMSEKN
jgi:hypothetical protein